MIITIANQKGGVGKSTTAFNLGSALNRGGKKILLIDLDSQTDLSTSLGISENIEYTINDIFKGKSIKNIITKLENGLHIIPASKELTGTQMSLKKGDVLVWALEDVRSRYEYIIIDTAPSMSILNVNALIASQMVIIALEPEYLALRGLRDFLNTIKLLDDKFNVKSPIIKILITKYDQRKILHREVSESIKKHFKDNLLKTKIRTCVKLAEAPSHFKDIFDYAPSSHASEDYNQLSKEILREVK
ncbi:Sporulation initiation inhibitor protein Soj [subsurface metagenome]